MKILLMILIGAAAGAILAMLGWPIQILYVIVVIFVTVSLANIVNVNVFSKNKATIEKYLKKHKKEPVYQFVAMQPYATDEEQIVCLEKILTKHKNPKYQAIYGCYLGLLQNDTEAARTYIKPIEGTEHGNYCAALVAIKEGNYDAAKAFTFKKDWMKHSVLGHIAYETKNHAQFNEHSKLAIDSVGGIQHYVNFHAFEKMAKQLQNQPAL